MRGGLSCSIYLVSASLAYLRSQLCSPCLGQRGLLSEDTHAVNYYGLRDCIASH